MLEILPLMNWQWKYCEESHIPSRSIGLRTLPFIWTLFDCRWSTKTPRRWQKPGPTPDYRDRTLCKQCSSNQIRLFDLSSSASSWQIFLWYLNLQYLQTDIWNASLVGEESVWARWRDLRWWISWTRALSSRSRWTWRPERGKLSSLWPGFLRWPAPPEISLLQHQQEQETNVQSRKCFQISGLLISDMHDQ